MDEEARGTGQASSVFGGAPATSFASPPTASPGYFMPAVQPCGVPQAAALRAQQPTVLVASPASVPVCRTKQQHQQRQQHHQHQHQHHQQGKKQSADGKSIRRRVDLTSQNQQQQQQQLEDLQQRAVRQQQIQQLRQLRQLQSLGSPRKVKNARTARPPAAPEGERPSKARRVKGPRAGRTYGGGKTAVIKRCS